MSDELIERVAVRIVRAVVGHSAPISGARVAAHNLHAAGLLATPEHDAAVAARALRALADKTSERHASSLFTGGADRPYGWGAVSTLLREEADRLEHDARCPHRKCPGPARPTLCCCPAPEEDAS